MMDDLPTVLDDLLKAEIISGKQILILKDETSVTYNPTFVMDLRHKQVKSNRLLNSNQNSKHTIIEEAKRHIRSSDRKVMLQKKEQQFIQKQIVLLKQQLDKVKIIPKKESHEILPASGGITEKLCDSYLSNESEDSNVLYCENYCSLQTHWPKENDAVASQTKNKINSTAGYRNKETVLTEKLPVVCSVDDKTSSESKSRQYTDDNVDFSKCTAAFARRVLLRYSFAKWMNYAREKRLLADTSSSTLGTDQESLLAKYWHLWCSAVRQKQKRSEKIIEPEKIEMFMKSLHDKKLQVCNNNREKLHSKHTTCKLLSEKKKQYNCDVIVGSEVHSKSHKVCVHDQRLNVQNMIIAEQKAEIEKKCKQIEELRLAQLRLEAEKSRREANDNLRKTQQTCDIALKAKANALVRGSSFRKSGTLPTLSHSCSILLRMNERRQEREKRWHSIREKKKCLEEEREKKLQKEEFERKMKEDEEKRHNIMVLRERRRVEKENELKKRMERERLEELVGQAVRHYNRHLLRRYGPTRWWAAVEARRCQLEQAAHHFNSTLLRTHLFAWRQCAQQSAAAKLQVAAAHYECTLLRHCFQRLQLVYNHSIRCSQVAADFHDLKLLDNTLRSWHCWTCLQHLRAAHDHARAVQHANRKLLASCVARWRRLPAVAHTEREHERRRNAWRCKVQQLLPDFRPASPL